MQSDSPVKTQLFWVSSKYYSPELGRFIQPADVSTLNPSSINGLNLYSYVNNNPIGIADSSSGTGINACIGIGSIHVSTLTGSFAVGLLSATALSGGWIILLSAGAAFLAGTATNHLLTKLEIGGNTIEGHLNNFVDWLIWWD